MVGTNQPDHPTGAPPQGGPPARAAVMPLFSTWIYLCEDGPSHLNAEPEQLAHRLMEDHPNAAGEGFRAHGGTAATQRNRGIPTNNRPNPPSSPPRSFRYALPPREGPVLYTVGYADPQE